MSELAQSEALKKEGNHFFSHADYISALVKYTEAICSNRNHSVLYSNRAATFLKLESWENAVSDCTKGLELLNDKSNETIKLKLLWRKSIGLRKLKRLDDAMKTIQAALSINSTSDYIRSEYNLIQQELNIDRSDEEMKDQDQTENSDLLDIIITEVDTIPKEFYNGKTISKATSTTKTTAFIKNQEQTSLVTDKVVELNNSTNFPIYPSLQFLLSLQDRPQSEQLSTYEYLLKLSTEAYKNIFAVTGIDAEVLNMFLNACIALLEKNKLEYKFEIIEKLELFKKLPRFSLTSMFVDSKIIERISYLFESKINENFEEHWK